MVGAMKIAWSFHGILLLSISTASLASADDLFKAGDKVTVRQRNESSRGEIVVSARNSQGMLIRLDSILGGRSGVVPIFADQRGGYIFATGDKISISK
jgi:hypothetical protein